MNIVALVRCDKDLQDISPDSFLYIYLTIIIPEGTILLQWHIKVKTAS